MGLWLVYGQCDLKLNIAFFKQVVRHANNFINVLLTLSARHQMMMSYYLHTDVGKQALCITKISEVPLDVLYSDIQEALREKSLHLSNCAVS